MNYYIICPFCGYQLLKANDKIQIEILCPRCKEKFVIEVNGNKIDMERIKAALINDEE